MFVFQLYNTCFFVIIWCNNLLQDLVVFSPKIMSDRDEEKK